MLLLLRRPDLDRSQRHPEPGTRNKEQVISLA
jgi:hypothetical protein